MDINKIQQIKTLNELILQYEKISDILVEKMRKSSLYSKEESDYLNKIQTLDLWTKNAKKLKEELYA